MKCLLPFLFCSLALAQTPPAPIKRDVEHRLYSIQRATLSRTNTEYHGQVLKAARTNGTWTWTPSDKTARECMYFEVHVKTNLNASWRFSGYVTNATWPQRFTNGMEFVRVRAWDRDMTQPSPWF